MPERIMVAAFVLGSVLLLVALLRGPIKIFNVEVQSATGRTARWVAGVVGIALVGAGLYVALRSLPPRAPDQAQAGAPPTTASSAMVEASSDTSAASEALVEALMAVRCGALPNAVPAGQAGELVIQVSSAATPVPGADVSVEVNGGAFPSGERRIVGRTAQDGVLKARWLAPASGGPSFLVSARASKAGYRSAGARCNVDVLPPGPPPTSRPTLAPMLLGCSSNPGGIRYGTTSELVIRTITPGHEPIPDVDLRLDGGGGSFLPSGYRTLSASTTGNGVFRTLWRPPPSGGPIFTIRVSAAKDGYAKGESRCQVSVDYGAPPYRPPAAPLVVGCSFSPSRIAVPATVDFQVWATSAEGAPIADATVKAVAGDGVFAASGGTSMGVRTRVDGRFATYWTAPPGGGPVFYADVTASAPGYQRATGQCKVRIAPNP